MESLILAQDERWRRAYMQVERTDKELAPLKLAADGWVTRGNLPIRLG